MSARSTIRAALELLGEHDLDPRLVEAWVRVERPKLDGLTPLELEREVATAALCVRSVPPEESERVAASVGLAPARERGGHRWTIGARVWWDYTPRGGYGYVQRVPALVYGLGAKTVQIRTLHREGEKWAACDRNVSPRSLRPRVELVPWVDGIQCPRCKRGPRAFFESTSSTGRTGLYRCVDCGGTMRGPRALGQYDRDP